METSVNAITLVFYLPMLRNVKCLTKYWFILDFFYFHTIIKGICDSGLRCSPEVRKRLFFLQIFCRF